MTTILGAPLTITDRANNLDLIMIDDWHSAFCVSSPTGGGNDYKVRVIQHSAAGPVSGSVLSSAVSVNGEAYDWIGFGGFPNSSYGFYVEIESPGLQPSTIIARSLDYDLSNQTTAVGTATTQTTTKLPLNWSGQAYLVGVSDTKLVLLKDNGWYIFFTRSGNTITVEEADIARLTPPASHEFNDLIWIPGTNTAWAVMTTTSDDREPIDIQKVSIDPINHTLTFTGSIEIFNAGDGYAYLTACPLPGVDELVVVTWNEENPDFATSITRYSHFDHSTGTTTAGPSNTDEGPSTKITALDVDKFRSIYNRNLPSGGPTGIGVYAEDFSISSGTITADGNRTQLRNESVENGNIIANVHAASVQNWTITMHNDTGDSIMYFYQLSGGGVPPAGAYDVTHSGVDVVSFSADGQLIYVALKQDTGEQILVEAPRDDPTDWTQSLIEAAGTLINVIPVDANRMIVYGQFANNVNVYDFDIMTTLPTDISPPSLAAAPILKLDVSPASPNKIMACVGNGASSKIVKSDDGGSSWSDLITSIAFDPLALDSLWSGLGYPDRLMYGGASGVAYSPNNGVNILDFTGPIVNTVTTITVQE